MRYSDDPCSPGLISDTSGLTLVRQLSWTVIAAAVYYEFYFLCTKYAIMDSNKFLLRNITGAVSSSEVVQENFK